MGFVRTQNVFSDRLMEPTEAAYVAGLVDGEGTIGLRAKHRKGGKAHQFNPTLAIANTNLKMLEAVIRLTGNGQIFEDRRGTGQRSCYDWKLSANQIRHVLPQIEPYLVAKKTQAELLLRFLGLVAYPVGVKVDDIPTVLSIRESLSELNRRGVDGCEESKLSLKEPRCTEPDCASQSYRGHPWCYQHWKTKREVQEASCTECGQPMVITDRRKRFCSLRCQHAQWYRTVDKPRTEREASSRSQEPCLRCGEPVDRTRYKTKRFCSERCQLAAYNAGRKRPNVACQAAAADNLIE